MHFRDRGRVRILRPLFVYATAVLSRHLARRFLVRPSIANLDKSAQITIDDNYLYAQCQRSNMYHSDCPNDYLCSIWTPLQCKCT